MNSVTEIGRSLPLGATIAEGGVNFSLFSRTATGVELLFFDHESDARPSRVVPIDPAANRTYHYWHVFVPGAEAGQIYGYRVQGPHDPSRGMRFDPAKILLDPYGRGVVVPGNYSRDSPCKHGENTATAMKSVVVDSRAYDWEGDTPLRQPWARTIIYEMHVRGFTRHPSSNIAEERRGTFAGLVAKIPYLQQLGITAVELLPVFQVGSFIGDSWREWNGRFRDDVRSFFRGEENSVRRFADRIVGSPEICGHKEREMGTEY